MCGLWLLHALGSAAGADCKGQNLKAVTVVPACVVRPQGSRPHYGRWSRNGRYGTSSRDCLDQSGLMPANLTTLAHFSTSLAMSLSKSAGEPPSVVLPRSASCALILGSASAALISVLSFSMISTGVFLG